MSTVERPAFYEGQILAAADLEALATHGRASIARHQRHQHTAGIVTGLGLVTEEQTDEAGNTFQDVTIEAGMAVDTGGRQVVVSEPQLLDPGVFDQINGAGVDENAWYPIFLLGEDVTEAAAEPFGAEACGTSALPTRITEVARIVYGRLGETAPTSGDDQGDDLDAATPTRPQRMLVGYVKWSVATGRFAEATTTADGAEPVTMAGLAGDEVAARSGRLELRTGLGRAAGTPAVRMQSDDGGRFAFGVISGTGDLDEVFSIDATGNIDAKGRLSAGTLVSGATYVASGIASDGVILPLPEGVTQQQVDDGAVTVHARVTPLWPGATHPDGDGVIEIPVECEVAGDRRVRCRTRFLDLAGPVAAAPAAPAACRYLVVAAVPPTGGA